jgi:U3 small nucleolar RNA-associated protein 15
MDARDHNARGDAGGFLAGGLGEYRKLPVKRYSATTIRETAEGRYWREYKSTVLSEQVNAVTSVSYGGVGGEGGRATLAATAGARVTLYAPSGARKLRTFARFKDIAYSGVLRDDGKALAVGGQAGLVQLFDCGSRAVLRKFTTHTAAVRCVRWSADKLHLASASDDATVRIWDISTGNCVRRHDGHTDYVRALERCPASTEMWASGSYDHTVKIWDAREGREAVMTLNHGSPVEDVAWYPNGNLLVSVGGEDICVWDTLSGGRLLQRLRSHQKTITTVDVHADAGPPSFASGYETGDESGFASKAPRLITGSLDGFVKVHELDTFKVTHSIKYPGPVLSCSLSPDANCLATGLANKVLSVRRRTKARNGDDDSYQGVRSKKKGFTVKKPRRLDAGHWRYFIRGQNSKAAADATKVLRQRRVHLAAHDRMLKQFRYGDALDAALHVGRTEVVAAVIEEVGRRGGLQKALANRDDASLLPVLEYVEKNISKPRHTAQMVNISNRIIDLYGGDIGASAAVDKALGRIKEKIKTQLRLHDALTQLQGMALMITGQGL